MPDSARIVGMLLLLGLFQSASAPHALADNEFLRKGIKNYNDGNFADAAGNLGAALSTDFNDPVLHYYLGNSYLRLRQKDAAIREFRIAYALQPDADVGKYAKRALSQMGIGPSGDGPAGAVDSLFTPSGHDSSTSPLGSPQLAGDHSEMLPGLSGSWRAGCTFDQRNLPSFDGNGPWFRLPDWLAGSWAPSTNSTMQTYSIDFRSKAVSLLETTVQRNLEPEQWGMLKDSSGQIWDHRYVPNLATQTQGGDQLIELSVRFTPTTATVDRVETYYRSVVFTVAADKRIKSVVQFERVCGYTHTSSAFFEKHESIKQFDQDGRPLSLVKFKSYYKQTAGFQNRPTGPNGVNNIMLFRDYLIKQGLNKLIPS